MGGVGYAVTLGVGGVEPLPSQPKTRGRIVDSEIVQERQCHSDIC